MEQRLLTFKPKDDELDYLEEYNIGFSEFCHQAFQWARNGKKYSYHENMANRLLVILLGLGFFALSYLIVNMFAWSIIILCSVFSIGFGTLSIIQELKSNGKR